MAEATELRKLVCEYRDELQRGANREGLPVTMAAAFRGVADRLNRILLEAPAPDERTRGDG